MKPTLDFPTALLSDAEVQGLLHLAERLWPVRDAIAARWSQTLFKTLPDKLAASGVSLDLVQQINQSFLTLILERMRGGDFEGLSQAYYEMNRMLLEADLAIATADSHVTLADLYSSARLALYAISEHVETNEPGELIAYGKLGAHLLMLVGLAYSDVHEEALERVVAERTAALTKQKALADTIIETLPGLFFLIDHRERIVRWNPELERLSGYDAAKLASMHPLEFFDAAERPELAEKMRLAFESGAANAEAELVARDGSRHPRWFTSKRLSLDDGTYLVGVGIDISERRRAEQRVQSEKRFADSIIESLPGIFYLFDENGRFLRWNKNFEAVSQYSADEIANMHPLEFFDAEAQGLVAERIGQVFVGGQATVEADFIARNGSRRAYFFTGHRVEVAGQNCLIGMGVDVTERKQAEDAVAARTRELARSNADLEQFAYVASHDLQEPLRAVKSYTQLLARRYQHRLDGEAARYIDRAVAAVSRMQCLIDDLLAYSRVGTVAHPIVATDCSGVVRDVLDDLQPAIAEAGAAVSYDALPLIPADRSQLRQLLQNLIGNAIKFRAVEPPRVHISAQPDVGRWHFTVRDNGIGIEPEYAQRVFVIFQRLHSRRQYPGTGVGLAVCKRIVERHGGRIWIEPAVEGGTCVHFVLPAQGSDERRAAVGAN